MDIVYASLHRRRPDGHAPPGEVAEVLGALWAHATSEESLEHACGHSRPDRVDLMLFFLTLGPATAPARRDAVQRTTTLLARCHTASPLLRRRYLPPGSPALAAPGALDC